MSTLSLAAAPRTARRAPRARILVAGALVVALAAVAFLRGGLLGLPAVPRDVDARRAGLADLAGMAARARAIEDGARSANPVAPADPALAQLALSLAAARRGDENGLVAMRAVVEKAPDDLVIGNAYRMAVFHQKRAALADPARRVTLAEQLPPALQREPIAFLERLHREHPSRETALQLALAWADELLLYGALEIKAPASVESVDLLTTILRDDPHYVPALYGRGLNYLHRPGRLVWPESHKAPPDAASHDFGWCVAIGRKIGGASPRLVSTLALTLGDAYAKEGAPDRARSWWQIAQNASRNPELLEAVRRRFGWEDAQMPDRLETELAGRMLDLDHPLTDLSVMWRRD